MSRDCVFCDHSNIRGIESLGDGVFVFTPLNPVVPTHKVFISDVHSTDASDNIDEFAKVARAVALYARGEFDSYNIITSRGSAATQTVFHMHVHLVPRADGDGLQLPWSSHEEQADER